MTSRIPKPSNSNQQLLIFNSGDLSIDYHIQVDTEFEKNRKYTTSTNGIAFSQIGSAAFTGRLLNALLQEIDPNYIQSHDLFNPLVPYSVMRYPSTFSMIRKFGNHTTKNGDTIPSWRVAEFLGRTSTIVQENYLRHCYHTKIDQIPDFLILSEYNHYFRQYKSIWPDCISDKLDVIPTTFLRCSFPLISRQNILLESLLNKTNAKSNLIILTTIDDLRLSDIYIRQGLSWESTALDLVSAFESKNMQHFQKASFVIVMLNNYGAFLYQNTEDQEKKYCLFYSREQIEENNEISYFGNMHGLNTGLLLHLVYKFIKFHKMNKDPFTVVKGGILSGLEGISSVFKTGFTLENIYEEAKNEYKFYYPTKELFKNINKRSNNDFEYSHIPISLEKEKRNAWTLYGRSNILPIKQVCIDVIEKGVKPQNLGKIPYSNFGDFLIVGRKETEDYREIKKLLASYGNKLDQNRPLSIAVLGEPGSGKSFGIKKIATSIYNSKEKTLEFNLSQLHNKKELIDAFHLIRDSAIQGRTVITFWDEFDSFFENEEFGWVKYFLAPMQDGIFYEGPVSHSIGQSVFVFISSKYKSMQEINSAIEKIKHQPNGVGNESKTSTKLIDFKSRLQGHIEVPGINQQKGNLDKTGLRLRRAILLRSLLQKHCLTIFEDENKNNKASIDPGLITAFIETKEYYHGARSMEAILAMSHLDGKSRFNRSCLPAENQLNLHVNSDNFWDIINKQ